MEPIITTLIYTHAFLGGLGLLSGILSILFIKGSRRHKSAGVLFSYAMGGSALISLLVAKMPGHYNEFLFCIGLFTLYMILAGNRALSFKGGRKTSPDLKDRLLSGAMALVATGMLLQWGISHGFGSGSNLLWAVFGCIGLALSMSDFRNYTKLATDSSRWLRMHLGRMVGAFIASVTAFIIAGLGWNGLFFWIGPTLVGSAYIGYYNSKIKGKNRAGQVR